MNKENVLFEIVIKEFGALTPYEVYDILKARNEIFIVEQNCVYQDIDTIDKKSLHIYLHKDAELLAYLRIYKDEKRKETWRLGRILTTQRNKGYGAEIVKIGIDKCFEQDSCKSILIEAQCYAQIFYEKLGFVAFGEMFLEDDIPHIKMKLEKNP